MSPTRNTNGKRIFFGLLILGITASLVVALGMPSSGLAQPAESPAPPDSSQLEKVSPLPVLSDSLIPLPVQPTEKLPAPSFVERVDHGFATTVDWMMSFLFYKLFPQPQESITTNSRNYYVRDADSKDPFQGIDITGKPTGKQLTFKQAEALKARGKLELGTAGRLWRTGVEGDRAVEFVTVNEDVGTKYVLGVLDGTTVFRKDLEGRVLLGTAPEDILTLDQAKKLALQGRLQPDSAKLTASGALKPGMVNPYLSEGVVGGAPLVVLWLAVGSVFFTFYMRGFNIWGFRHAFQVVRGRYDNPNEPGEVTHFQALSSALSATVGLGNIAGVTIAMTIGGPGAFFWMMACGFFGMTSKFVECTLGQKFRTVKPDGTILGGPMQYLSAGLKQLGLGPLGSVLAIMFSVMCILASFGGGNMFQANQAGSAILFVLQDTDRQELEQVNQEIKSAAVAENFAHLDDLQTQKQTLQEKMDGFKKVFVVVFGIVLAVFVALVIIGGIKRIGAAAEKIVPTMCGIYVLACLYVIFANLLDVPPLVAMIFTEAFNPQAFGGGLLGVLVIGVQRAAFSNEAGVGSAAIAHSAAKTEEPVREGAVALMGPFIDTIVICSMTALVILVTGAWDNEAWLEQGLQGSALASRAFESQISWFPWLLTVAIVLFAYSTIISWSYYGERCWERLFGARTTICYKALSITCVFIGTIAHLGAVLDFSDLMILSMAFPNILGAVLLAPGVKRDLASYWRRYRSGEFKTYK